MQRIDCPPARVRPASQLHTHTLPGDLVVSSPKLRPPPRVFKAPRPTFDPWSPGEQRGGHHSLNPRTPSLVTPSPSHPSRGLIPTWAGLDPPGGDKPPLCSPLLSCPSLQVLLPLSPVGLLDPLPPLPPVGLCLRSRLNQPMSSGHATPFPAKLSSLGCPSDPACRTPAWVPPTRPRALPKLAPAAEH